MMNPNDFQVLSNYYDEFDTLLTKAISQLNINVDSKQKRHLLLYLDKLLFWNKAYNLTAIKQPKEALIKHIIDCLAILPHLKQGKLLDIGTGAGLPGVIIAICEPHRDITVLDSNQKKIRFIRQVVSDLNIANITPIASRIENFNPEPSARFDVITSRAFASLTDFVEASEPSLTVAGSLQAMKGLEPSIDEIDALQGSWKIETMPLSVPMLDETRHIIDLRKKS